MTRFRAAGLHFIFSVMVVFIILTLMLSLWFPHQYFKLMGGGNLMYLIAGIDICLGPLLTLAVFKSGKKSLNFDLAVIGLVQIAALSFGCYTMYNARPIFTAYADGEFSIATASEVTDDELKKAKENEWKNRSLTGPIVVSIAKPTDKKELAEAEFLAFGMGFARFPKYFVRYQSKRAEILKEGKPLNVLRTYDKKNNAVVNKLIKDKKRNEQSFVFLPISSFWGEMAAIVDAKTAEFITIIEAKPFPQKL